MESSAHRSPSERSPTRQGAGGLPRHHSRWGRRLRTLSVVLAGLVALYALLGFFVLPAYLRAKVPVMLSERLGHPVTIGDITLNPFTLAVTVKELGISEEDGSPLIGFEELYVNIDVASMLNRTLTFDQIRLRLPYGSIKIRQDGTLNLIDLRPKSPAPGTQPVQAMQEKSDPQQSLPSLIIRSLEVERGAVEFHDESRPTPFKTDIVPIWLTLKNFRTVHASDNAFAFNAEFEAGESLEWHGTLLLNPVRSDGHVSLSSLKMREVWEYIQDRAGFEITDGLLHVNARYHAEAAADAFHVTVSDGEIRLDQVTLLEKGDQIPLIVLPTFLAKGIQADLVQHHVEIGALQSNGARIKTWIDKEGVINLRRLFAATPASPAANPPANQTPSNRQPATWTATLKEISLDDYGISMEDRRPPSPVHLDVAGLRMNVKNVTYPPTGALDFTASMQVNSTGPLSTSGTLTADPVLADIDIDVAKFPLTPFQPYIGQAANVELRKGSVNLKGHLRYAPAEKQSIRFHGDARISQLATVDSQLNKDLVNWESLNLNTIDVALPTDHISVREVIAAKPYADIIISADRQLNIRTILTKSDRPQSSPAAAPAPAKAAQVSSRSPLIKIDSVKIRNGSAHFADFSVQPVVDTGIYGLKGTITGLSSEPQTQGHVALEGEVDKYAPVTVAGDLNPLSHDVFTDLGVSFKNVELTTLSPYSTKFAGYPIVKGKLSMDLHYKLEHHLLEAKNEVVIDQLTLGDKVEGPNATSLPVKLAVALLKDRHGRINIDLPVKGDLNNPEFEYGKLIWNVFTNLLTKVVTSPFSLIAKLVGGSGEELSEVPFPVGSAEIPAEKLSRLKALAKSLEERPALQLEVSGIADPEADGVALREAKLQRELDALQQASGRHARTSKAEAGGTEIAGLLKALYIKKFGRLPNQIDPNRPVPPEQLRERLLPTFSVEEEEVRLLAQERGKQIQHFLIDEAGIPANRVFLLDAKLTTHAKNGAVASQLSLTAG